MLETAVIEVEEGPSLSYEAYERIRDRYWVISYRDRSASWFDWMFSIEKPNPVPNPDMHWRRPTYLEACIRQAIFEKDPERFMSLHEQYAKGSRYR